LQYLSKSLEAEIHQGKIEMHLEPRGLVVSLRQATFFPSGADTVDPNTYSSVGKIAQIIHDLPNSVRLEGHTDAVPIHTARFRSNWELSAARAIAMMELFSGRFEIPPQRMAIAAMRTPRARFQRHRRGPGAQPPCGHRDRESAGLGQRTTWVRIRKALEDTASAAKPAGQKPGQIGH